MIQALLPILITLVGTPQNATQLPFSSFRKAGPTLYVSGSLARTPEGENIKDSVTAETHQIMKNIGHILAQNGYGFDDVVKATVYLRDLGDYAEMNKAYATYFKNAFPSRACIGDVDIVLGFKVEISCIAYKE